MDQQLLGWAVFGLYALVTTVLALRGMRRTTDLSSFALGAGDLGPVLVGITLAAAIASTATFVINPGFVYAHGLSALMHLGFASFSGVIVGLALFSKGFRKSGNEGKVLTLPHWIGNRYGHRAMRTYFALLNLVLAITFIVLIVKGSALVMQHTLGTSYIVSLVIIVGFVFSYILMGGTYAHVYTNALQGALMIVVALMIVGSGFHLLSDGLGPFLSKIGAQDPNLVKLVNPESSLFNDPWSVFGCGFIIGIGLIAQPHILTKALYLKHDKQVNRYLGVGAVVCIIYAMVLFAGLYARLTLSGTVAQDAVMPLYLKAAFGPVTGVLISVALLAAGMSTLDGILVSASTIAANDVFLGTFGERLYPNQTEAERQVTALKASRIILVITGVVSFLVALDPPKLAGIFAQVGIYGLVAASLLPIALGIFTEKVHANDVFVGAVVGPAVHFAHYSLVVSQGGVLNPAVSATSGIIASFVVVGLLTAVRRAKTPEPRTATPTTTP